MDYTTKRTINKVLKPLNSKKVEKIIEKHNCDYNVKKMETLQFIKLMVNTHLQEHNGVRDISSDLIINEDLQEYLGLETISYSQINRRLNSLDTRVSEKIFNEISSKFSKKLVMKNNNRCIKSLNLIDASTVSKALSGMEWAKFRKDKAGIKLHLAVKYHSKDKLIPNKAIVSKASHADVNYLDALVDDEQGVINVFDLGYLSYKEFDRLTSSNILFVTKLKNNAFVVTKKDYPTSYNFTRVCDVVLGSIE